MLYIYLGYMIHGCIMLYLYRFHGYIYPADPHLRPTLWSHIWPLQDGKMLLDKEAEKPFKEAATEKMVAWLHLVTSAGQFTYPSVN